MLNFKPRSGGNSPDCHGNQGLFIDAEPASGIVQPVVKGGHTDLWESDLPTLEESRGLRIEPHSWRATDTTQQILKARI